MSNDSLSQLLNKAKHFRRDLGNKVHEDIVESIYDDAARIAKRAVDTDDKAISMGLDRAIDRVVTSRLYGFPLMMLLLTLVFWLTISGANVPSSMLATLFLDIIYPGLKSLSESLNISWWLDGLLIDGVYLAVGWVISVMLPPMAIFFPLFTLLEDLGYLPRIAFNLDNMFRKTGAHGKQALSMAMGWGCNAAGVISTRIIDSPRERLIAIITNNFSLCNGRWPTQILVATVFIGGLVPAHFAGVVSAMSVVAIAVLGILLTFLVSWALSRSVLRGESSVFNMELPPYRMPHVWQTVYTSIIDRTLPVLWRAILWAVPAGALIWLTSNINIDNISFAEHVILLLDPFGFVIGLNGVILLAYILAIPANEIIVPTILMLTVLSSGIERIGLGAGVMFELDSLDVTLKVFEAGGWTLLTAVNLMLFSLIHNPCSTTIHTIYKETGSVKWTLVSTFLPLLMGFVITFLVAQFWRIIVNWL